MTVEIISDLIEYFNSELIAHQISINIDEIVLYSAVVLITAILQGVTLFILLDGLLEGLVLDGLEK